MISIIRSITCTSRLRTYKFIYAEVADLQSLIGERMFLYSFIRGTQREYRSKPLKHSIVERILVFKR